MVEVAADVHDDTVAHHLTGYAGAAGTGDEVCVEAACFMDEFYDFRFGKLDYRTVSLQTEILDTPNFQGNAVVNYTSKAEPFTRIIEHKHFELFGDAVYARPKTVISREYPCEWSEGMEPFYPVNDEKNSRIYKQYKELADKEKNVVFGGRLAEYKYYDMAPIVEKVLDLK